MPSHIMIWSVLGRLFSTFFSEHLRYSQILLNYISSERQGIFQAQGQLSEKK